MNEEILKHVIVMRSKNGVIMQLHFFENVTITTTDKHSVHLNTSSAFCTFDCSRSTFRDCYDENIKHVNFPWYEQIHVFESLLDIYDFLGQKRAPEFILTWLTKRI